ncbi:sugar transporter domain-containing protein [Ditylenchus destructor]|uniref:Sugar transporter domain-containing protein n=1 Tax=Ditylenchus destructor TaxID=166010 RepID=A0AAD4MZV3_9BILA|nr:sugar transporter domain-containing protein [Ditylenchus destructor]
MFVSTLVGIVAVLCALPELFIVSRILGAGMGSECPKTELRGTCYFIAGTTFTATMVVGTVLGMDIIIGDNVLLIVGIGAIPTLLCCLFMLPTKETPKYLLVKENNRQAAMESLIFYQGYEVDHQKFLDETLKEEEDSHCEVSTLVLLKEIFYKPYLMRAVLLGIASMQLIVGFWPISTQLLMAHFPLGTAQMFSSIFNGVSFLSGITGVFIIGRVQRRKLMVGSSIASLFFLMGYIMFDRLAILVAPIFKYGCFATMFLCHVFFGVGYGTIAFYITGELLPQLHRSLGQSVVFFVTLAVSFFFSFVTLPAYETYSVWAFIPLFVIPGIVCVIYLYLYLPETRGKEIHEIVEEMKQSFKTATSRESLNPASEPTNF